MHILGTLGYHQWHKLLGVARFSNLEHMLFSQITRSHDPYCYTILTGYHNM